MKTLIASFAIFMLTTNVVSAQCMGEDCSEYLGKHIRLHKGSLENKQELNHCVNVRDISASKNIRENAKSKIKSIKIKRGSNKVIKVVVDESSTACMIGNI